MRLGKTSKPLMVNDTEKEVRAIFACKWCGAEHAYPERNGWANESELQSLMTGMTTFCPGNQECMLAPHYEYMINGKPAEHRHNFELVDIEVRE
tara:strand:- start:462 stop:743 length:282 start_codon:yes stop_codon:yes gene_type:complete